LKVEFKWSQDDIDHLRSMNYGFAYVNKILKACRDFKQVMGLEPNYDSVKIFMKESDENTQKTDIINPEE
jgi:hypothetical protein